VANPDKDHTKPHREGACKHCPLDPVRREGRVVWCPCGSEIPIEIPVAPSKEARLLKLRCSDCIHLCLVLDVPGTSGRQSKA
jgi:hypothetical protein